MDIESIRHRIQTACSNSGRKPEDITIIGVTKSQSVEAIAESVKHGIYNIGESYIQEAVQKIEDAKAKLSDQDYKKIIWHFIGKLQTNKIKYLKNIFAYLHSIDNDRQLTELNNRMDSPLNIFFEINTGEEKTKGGQNLENTFRLFEKLMEINNGRKTLSKPELTPVGLMCIPPFDDDSEKSRPHFAMLRENLEKINREFGVNMKCLSMGMSSDFDVAIEEGATHVRIGTLLYGERNYA